MNDRRYCWTLGILCICFALSLGLLLPYAISHESPPPILAGITGTILGAIVTVVKMPKPPDMEQP